MSQKITPGLALRNLQQAQQGMKKVRKGLVQLREIDPARRPELAQSLLQAGWESLTRTNREIAAIPFESATDEVMLRQIAVQRYATALLVRLRRVLRNDLDGLEGPDDED